MRDNLEDIETLEEQELMNVNNSIQFRKDFIEELGIRYDEYF